MDDEAIIQLYFERDDHAIKATSQKYGGYCTAIAKNILKNNEDAEECVNDTYFNAWKIIPPQRPKQLSTFLGKITRNLAYNKYRCTHAEKRGNGEFSLVLDELSECVSDNDTVDKILDRKELIKAINDFLEQLPEEKQAMFVRRYWYADSIAEIAKDYGMMQGTVSKSLERTRKKLKAYLTERGFEL